MFVGSSLLPAKGSANTALACVVHSGRLEKEERQNEKQQEQQSARDSKKGNDDIVQHSGDTPGLGGATGIGVFRLISS